MEPLELLSRLEKKKLRALVEIQAEIGVREFEEMFDYLINKINATLETERCAIFRISPDIQMAELVAGKPAEEHGLGMKFSFDDLAALKEAVEGQSYLLIEQPRQDERTKGSRELIYFKNINAMLFVPLLIRGDVLGVFVADATGGKKGFNQEEIAFCLVLSNLISLLLLRDKMHQEMEARKTLEILGQAAAEAAHRMKNPLVAIGGFADRFIEGFQRPRLSKNLLASVASLIQFLALRLLGSRLIERARVISQEVRRLESTVESLLRFSRAEKIKADWVNVNEVIEETVKFLVDNLIEGKEIEIELKKDSRLPSVWLDAEKIKWGILDILTNAAEAIAGKGKISILTRKENNYTRISIVNTGSISKEAVDHIFDPFFTTKPDGTGLGLSTALAAIKAHDGELTVQSDEKLNLTTFIIRLPIKQPEKMKRES